MSTRQAWVDVDLGAVAANVGVLRQAVAPAELCAVVKADGYGHGMVPCAEAALAGGASWLAVATADEAAALRRGAVGAPILVQGALTGDEVDVALAAGADVVASSEAFAAELAERARAGGRRARVHVKLDTGMGRLGAKDPAEARAVVERADADPALELVGVMTHFATADEPGDAFFDVQLERFARWVQEVRAGRPHLIAHAANSAATLREPRAHFDLVRCGIALYGLDPFGEDPAARALEPALSLHSYVAQVKRFSRGESAGYGRRWHAVHATWVGVVPLGYGDGWRRGLTNNADVLVGGRRRPLVGTVSMDNLTVDLGPRIDVAAGEEAVLIGSQGAERVLCEEVARRLGTINYEVTCGLLPRIPRLHGRT